MFTAPAARSRQNMKTVVNISTALERNRAPGFHSRLSNYINPTGTPARRQLNQLNAAEGQLSIFVDTVLAPITASLRFPHHSAVNRANPHHSAAIRSNPHYIFFSEVAEWERAVASPHPSKNRT
jgi:hypothetical protein